MHEQIADVLHQKQVAFGREAEVAAEAVAVLELTEETHDNVPVWVPDFHDGTPVMEACWVRGDTGGYGVAENGSWEDYMVVRAHDVLPVPDGIDDVVAASVPVAYLTAMVTLSQAGFAPGETVFAPAIGGSVGNATYQLAKTLGAATVVSTAGSAEKARRARELGYGSVIDLTAESIGDGVRRITDGKGADIVIESLGGAFTGQALDAFALDGTLVTLGYSAGREAHIDVTNLIWKRARMFGFVLAAQPPTAKLHAWNKVMALIARGAVVPLVEPTYPLERAAEALRYLHDERQFDKIVLEV